jgi:uncharacterized repeat protein (TIGR03803 family)
LVIALLVATNLFAQSNFAKSNATILYRFQNAADGALPAAPLVADASGNLYGTTGGANGPDYGSVFRFTPPTGGQCRDSQCGEATLYSFHGQLDGAGPVAALILDDEGNLYGTTSGGGANGVGTVFKLSPPPMGASGEWTEQILHIFSGGEISGSEDGADPVAPLVRDAAGNLYGVTSFGGAQGNGVIFELSLSTETGDWPDAWSEKILYTFGNAYGDCVEPENIVLADGALYGPCYGGGSEDNGLLFSLTRSGNSWTYKTIYEFAGGRTGWRPLQIALGVDGNLYGTTFEGGIGNGGIVFELLRPVRDGAWTERIIYDFPAYFGDHPLVSGVGVSFGPDGVLYGSEPHGGNGFGSLYQLTPPSNPAERWAKIPLYAFPGGFGGDFPEGPPVSSGGVLYGTTGAGGYLVPCDDVEGCGTVYAVKP